MTIGEILEKAAVNTMIGMGSVFFMLILIICVISLFCFIPEAKPKTVKAGGTKQESPAADSTDGNSESLSSDEDQVAAVIAAAIAAATEAEEETRGSAEGRNTYIVRSVRRMRDVKHR